MPVGFMLVARETRAVRVMCMCEIHASMGGGGWGSRVWVRLICTAQWGGSRG